MQITSRFTVAIHTILCIAHYEGKKKVTSTVLSASTGADATIIRRLLGQLQTAGYVTVKAGVGGAYLTKPLKEITLLDLFKACLLYTSTKIYQKAIRRHCCGSKNFGNTIRKLEG